MTGRRNGFTLLEMLVVLAVFGLLMVTITEGMRFAGEANRAAEATVEWTNQIEPADRALRAMIEQIRPQGTLETTAALDGGPRSMAFKTELSDPSLALGQAQARIELRFGADHQLVADSQPAPNAIWNGPPPPVRETVLVDHLNSVSLAYWDGSHWLDHWSANGLPGLIRIRLIFPPGDSRRWPDIIAAPMRETLP